MNSWCAVENPYMECPAHRGKLGVPGRDASRNTRNFAIRGGSKQERTLVKYEAPPGRAVLCDSDIPELNREGGH